MEFIYNGKFYNSMTALCKEHNVSYSRLCRIRRKYRKAKSDISLAIAVAKGEICLNDDELNHVYVNDKEKSRIRYLNFKTRQTDKAKHQALELFNIKS